MNCNHTVWFILILFSLTALIISRVYYIRLLGKKFADLKNSLLLINNNLNNFAMATQQQFDDVISRIEAATNMLADEVRKLQDEIKAQGLPQDAEDSIVSKLGDLAARLESIGQSTDEPLPGVVGSNTRIPLGQGSNDTTVQQPVTSDNTGENTPAPQGDVTADNTSANATMNPFPEAVQPQPGDTQENISADSTGDITANKGGKKK